MRLGASISQYGNFPDPEAYVAECVKWGYRSAPCPKVGIAETEKMRATERAFAKADIKIAEVEAWVNPLDPRPQRRQQSLRTIAEALAIADEVGAACCVTVAGSFSTVEDETVALDSPHPVNFAPSTFDAVVEWIKEVLQQVNPRRAKLALEMGPWTILEGPEVYRKVIDAVDHPGFGAHLDPANAIRDAHLYYSTTALLNLSFDLLGQWIVSCHAKDILQSPKPDTVSLMHVPPGKGVLDYRTFLARIEQVSPATPLILEHLATEKEFLEAAQFIRTVARELAVTA